MLSLSVLIIWQSYIKIVKHISNAVYFFSDNAFYYIKCNVEIIFVVYLLSQVSFLK